MRSSLPPQGTPPGVNITCVRCDAQGVMPDGEACDECAGACVVRDYVIGRALRMLLEACPTPLALAQALTDHADGCEQREIMMRRAGLTLHADLASAEACQARVISESLVAILSRSPAPPTPPARRLSIRHSWACRLTGRLLCGRCA